MKRFDIITEADARTLDIGATVELSAGGHVTPLAKDTLASRRVTVIRAGSADATLPDDLAPAADVRRVVIGSDHTGVAMKKAIVQHLRHPLPLAVLLMGFGVMRNPTLGPLAASLKSTWLFIHVAFAWLSFGAYALAMAGGIVHELKRGAAPGAPRNPIYDRVPALDRLDELLFRWIAFGFVTHAVMIASGAIWARELWGSYWSWDPVETWSLVTWLMYGLAIHLRVTRGWRGARFARLAVGSIAGMIVSFFGVTFVVDTSNHFFNVR